MPPLHLQPLAAGARILRRLSHRPHRHARDADHRLLQPEPASIEYNHERAVADGVNVGYDVYRIKTQVTEQGGKVEKGFYVDHRSKETRAARWERARRRPRLTPRGPRPLGRRALARSAPSCRPSRTLCSPSCFPGRTLVPKTLIFAKDDSHAEDIVHLVPRGVRQGQRLLQEDHLPGQATPRPASATKSPRTLIQEFRTLAAAPHRRDRGHDRHRHRHQAARSACSSCATSAAASISSR